MWENEALKGQVKDAINQKINHQEIPILNDLYDVLYETGQSFTKLIRNLQDSLSEHTGNAVINSQYLDQLIKQLHSFDDDVQQEVKSINAKMAEASSASVQLKALSGDKCLKKTSEAQKLLTKTNQTLAQFNQRNDQSLSQHLAQISKQLKGIEGVSSLSYTDPQSLAFYSDTHYQDHVKSVHQAISCEVLEKQDPNIVDINKNITMDDLVYIQNQMTLYHEHIGNSKNLIKNIKKALSVILLGNDKLQGMGDVLSLRKFQNEKMQQLILNILGLDIKKNKKGERQIVRWFYGKNHIRYLRNKGQMKTLKNY